MSDKLLVQCYETDLHIDSLLKHLFDLYDATGGQNKFLSYTRAVKN